MLTNENIIHKFFKRSILATIFISIVSIGSIYIYLNYNFYNTLTDQIKSHIRTTSNNGFHIDENKTEDNIQRFMEKSGFPYVEVYNEKKEKLYTFKSENKLYTKINSDIIGHRQLFPNEFPVDIDDMNYELLKIDGDNYFLQVIYPIYSDNKLFGYIEGITKLDHKLVSKYKRDVIITIATIILTILFMVLTIFPIVYFAYKHLEEGQNILTTSNIMTLKTLGNAIALRDNETSEHNYRVTIYAIKLAEHMKLDNESIQTLIKGAFLHDIGKIGIPDTILLKNKKLTQEEFEIIKTHTTKGARLIKGNKWLDGTQSIILSHHERFDGLGYPNGLKGEQIPEIVRIFSIVDVFDALTSKRPYKEAYSYEKSIQILKEGKGSQFDPLILENFLAISKELYMQINQEATSMPQKILNKLIKKYFY